MQTIDTQNGFWHEIELSTVQGSVDDFVAHFDRFESNGDFRGIRMPVPTDLGTGFWHMVRLHKDLYVISAKCRFERDYTLNVPGDMMVKVRVVLSGGLRTEDLKTNITGTGAMIESYPGSRPSQYIVSGGSLFHCVILNCGRDFFENDLGLEVSALPYPISHLAEQSHRSPRAGSISLSPDVLRAANEVLRNTELMSPKLFFAYLDAKAREIATLTVDSLNRAQTPQSLHRDVSLRELNRALEVRDLVLDNFQNPPTIPTLARTVSMNQTRLKQVFKSILGMTIYEFVLKCRMEEAYDLLTRSEKSIAQISYSVGYEHPASFSNAFRKTYGTPPRGLRAKTRRVAPADKTLDTR